MNLIAARRKQGFLAHFALGACPKWKLGSNTRSLASELKKSVLVKSRSTKRHTSIFGSEAGWGIPPIFLLVPLGAVFVYAAARLIKIGIEWILDRRELPGIFLEKRSFDHPIVSANLQKMHESVWQPNLVELPNSPFDFCIFGASSRETVYYGAVGKLILALLPIDHHPFKNEKTRGIAHEVFHLAHAGGKNARNLFPSECEYMENVGKEFDLDFHEQGLIGIDGVIRTFFQELGAYSGTGTVENMNIGRCIWGSSKKIVKTIQNEAPKTSKRADFLRVKNVRTLRNWIYNWRSLSALQKRDLREQFKAELRKES